MLSGTPNMISMAKGLASTPFVLYTKSHKLCHVHGVHQDDLGEVLDVPTSM